MRSVPLMMKVPRSVIIGKSPMKTVCSLISPVCAFMNRAVTKSGRGVRHVALTALVLRVLRRVEDVVGQLELQLTGEILDRRDVAEDLRDTLFEEPPKRIGLHFDEVRKVLDLAKLRKRETLTGRETSQRDSNRDLMTLRARRAADTRDEGLRRGTPEGFGRASTEARNFRRRERADTARPSIARSYAGRQYTLDREPKPIFRPSAR